MLLTNLYFQEKNYTKASYYISKALKIEDNNTLYWRRYSEINLKLNFFEEAIEGFEKCLELNDTAIEVYIGLADVLTFLGEFNDAVKVLQEAQKENKNFAEIEYRLAGLTYVLNDKEKAKNYLIKALKIDYDYHLILNELFPTVFEKEEVQNLLVNFKKAME